MPTNPTTLAQQIQRLMLSKDERQRLLEELKQADENKMKILSDLIREHDEEALKILDQKVAEQMKVKEQFQGIMPVVEQHATREQAQDVLQKLEIIFEDPEALAHFLVESDEVFLMQLEELFIKNLEKDKEAQDEFKRFFSEMRLSKAAKAQDWKKEDREMLINEISNNEKQSKQLDELIAEAQKVLKK